MEAIAKVRNIRVTPMKARRIVNLIRGKQASEALGILKFAPQAASEPVYKLVEAAIANAKVKADASNSYVDEDDLVISKAFVDEGITLKRFRPRAQGRAYRINKRTSHITVVVATPDEAAQKKSVEAAKPTKAAKPVQAAKPTKAAKPAQDAKPAKAAKVEE